MLRPRWIGMLALALIVAAVFAWLGQWQLSSAIDTDAPPPGGSEQTRPLKEVAAPGEYLTEPREGQRVATSGWWVPGDFLVVSSRYNGGVEGFWVTGQFRLADASGPTPVSLAVALAWAPTRADADAAASALQERVAELTGPAELTGRLIPDEGPALPPRGGSADEMTHMSPAALLDRWHDADAIDVFRPFLVADPDSLGLGDLPDGVVAIDSKPPAEGSSVNWLNLFYAAEWAVFAGFAFYMWYRLARDAWEKELEQREEGAAAA